MKHVTNIRVRYAETDRMGVTHHANYLIYLEQARTEFSAAAGFSYKQCEELGLMSPVLEIEVKYRSSSTYDDELFVECSLTKLSQSRMEFSYVTRKADGTVVNTACSRHCWVDSRTFRPASLKRAAPQVYQMLADCVEPAPEEK